MDYLHKFNNQIEERDKVFRLVQYSTHLLSALKKASDDKSLIEQLANVENAISLSRQMLRFGKCVEAINSSLSSLHLQDGFLRTTISLSRISNGLYLLCDNLACLCKIGLVRLNENRISKLASSYWLYSTILLLMKNLYQMHIIFQNHPRSFNNAHLRDRRNAETSICVGHIIEFAGYNKALTLEILKNICDICLSMKAADKFNFAPATIGFAGVVSSLIPLFRYRTLIH